MITDHKWRPLKAGSGGCRGGIRHGECAYLGTCKQPAEAHAEKVSTAHRRNSN